jgi:hypothetical protein
MFVKNNAMPDKTFLCLRKRSNDWQNIPMFFETFKYLSNIQIFVKNSKTSSKISRNIDVFDTTSFDLENKETLNFSWSWKSSSSKQEVQTAETLVKRLLLTRNRANIECCFIYNTRSSCQWMFQHFLLILVKTKGREIAKIWCQRLFSEDHWILDLDTISSVSVRRPPGRCTNTGKPYKKPQNVDN